LLQDLGDSTEGVRGRHEGAGQHAARAGDDLQRIWPARAENANGGTDHGAAAPMFIVGNKVKAGLLGQYPSLAPQDLFQGDIKYNVDFRSVYAGVWKTGSRRKARRFWEAIRTASPVNQ
jgi:hypothetical protein